jgi:hypothetical protein
VQMRANVSFKRCLAVQSGTGVRVEFLVARRESRL